MSELPREPQGLFREGNRALRLSDRRRGLGELTQISKICEKAIGKVEEDCQRAETLDTPISSHYFDDVGETGVRPALELCIEELLVLRLALARTTAVFEPLLTICTGIGLLAVLWVGGLLVIDGAIERGGGDASYINHSCEPNCEAVITGKRIYINALETIEAGTELAYDYQYERTGENDMALEKFYVCRCGAPNCRGTIMKPAKKRRRP